MNVCTLDGSVLNWYFANQTVTAVVIQHRSVITSVLVRYTGHTAITTMAIRSSMITTSIPEGGNMRKKGNQMAKAKPVVLTFFFFLLSTNT